MGIALTVGGIAGILTQTPAGALVDRLRSKRALIAAGIVALAVGALLIALAPTFWSVMSAQVLIGGTSSIFGPAICAISLGIVGRRLFDRRQGRNQAFNSAGNVWPPFRWACLVTSFPIAASSSSWWLCALPTIFALLLIRPDEIDYELARGAKKGDEDGKARQGVRTAQGSAAGHLSRLRGDVSLCQRRDAAALGRDAGQGAGPKLDDVHVGVRGDYAVCHHVACFLVGAESGVVGQKAAAALRVWSPAGSRRSLHAHLQHVALVAIQILDGVGAGIFGVVSVLVIADLTQGTGRFNLTLGAISTAVGIGASLSQVIAGSIVHHFGSNAGFLFLAAVASAAFGILYFFMPETRDKRSPPRIDGRCRLKSLIGEYYART